MEGIAMTITGMGTVFAVLIILYFIMVLMKKVFYKEDQIQNNNVLGNINTESEIKNDISDTTLIVNENEQDEEELVAILTASIAASLNTSTYNLRVMSFRRTNQSSPIWNSVGRKELLETKL